MRRPLLVSLLLLWIAAAGSAQPVGRVVDVAPKVTAGIAGKEDRKVYRPLVKKAPVGVGTEVVTAKQGGAWIRFGAGSEPVGTVHLGPESELLFESWVAEAALTGEASFRVQLGSLLAYFRPRTADQRKRITIHTPNGELYVTGTALYLEVAPDEGSTSVFVLEGTVTVVSKSGGEVTVTAGQHTRLDRGEPPTPPAPFRPGSSGTGLGLPTRPWILDPPLVDLDNPRLDLPK